MEETKMNKEKIRLLPIINESDKHPEGNYNEENNTHKAITCNHRYLLRHDIENHLAICSNCLSSFPDSLFGYEETKSTPENFNKLMLEAVKEKIKSGTVPVIKLDDIDTIANKGVDINGIIELNGNDMDEFMDKFLEFVESQGCLFAGGYKQIDLDSDEDDKSLTDNTNDTISESANKLIDLCNRFQYRDVEIDEKDKLFVTIDDKPVHLNKEDISKITFRTDGTILHKNHQGLRATIRCCHLYGDTSYIQIKNRQFVCTMCGDILKGVIDINCIEEFKK